MSKKKFYILLLIINPCLVADLNACPKIDEYMAMGPPDLAERIWIASSIYAEVKYKFAHFDALGPRFNFNEIYKNYIKEVALINTRFDFDKTTAKLFARLHNGHTRFYDELASCNPNLPLKADFIQGKWIITHSKVESIATGSEIISLDNMNFSDWADQQMKFIADSSIKSQRRLLTSNGYGAWLWPQKFTLGIRQPKKPIRTVYINRNIYLDETKNKEISNGRYEPQPGIDIQQINSQIVRISVSGFDQPENESKLIKAIHNNEKNPVILLDLRETEGGAMSVKLASLLAEQPFRDSISLTPQHIALNDLYQETGEQSLMIFPNTWMRLGNEIVHPQPIYHGRLFILTNGGCVSACESFILMMKSAKRAVILGSPTWGINGNKYQVKFDSLGINFSVSSEIILSPDGSPVEGIGIKPDIAIPITQRELLSGKDEVLKATISYIKKDIKGIHHAP